MSGARGWLLRLSLTASACFTLLLTAPAALAAMGGISGTVTRASDAAVVANVGVDIYDSGQALVQTVCTNSSGFYSATNLGPGDYTVSFAANFCGPLQNYQPQYYDGQSSSSTATTVTVSSGTTTTGIDAVLHAGGVITGTVTDASTASALADVEVDVYNSGGGDVALLCTAADGSYTAPGLVPGNYTVEFNPGNTICGPSLNYLTQFYDDQASSGSATTIAVTAGNTASGISAALQPGALITGIVTDSATTGDLAGVEVDLYDSSQAFVEETCTAANGSYSLANLATAHYYVEFETSGSNCNARGFVTQFYDNASSLTSAGAVAATQGQTTSGIDAAMAPSGAITGSVTDAVSHAAIQNVGVNVLSGGSVVEEVCTGSDGSYTAGGLEAGTYTVTFQPVSGCGTVSGYQDQAYGSAVNVSAGATTAHIDEALAPQAGTITGTVRSAATGQALAGVTVTASTAGGDYGQACTAADGTYSIPGLPAGSYTVYFDPLSSDCGPALDLIAQYYDGQSTSGSADAVTVDGSATVSGVDATLRAGGAIAGVVTDAATHRPIGDLPVQVYTPAGTAVSGGCTGSDGTYTIAGLSAGTYTVSFDGALGGCGQTHHYADQSVTNVPVSTGVTTTAIDAQLIDQSQGEVTGTVTASGSGSPLPGVVVTLYGSSGAQVGSTALTDAHGNYVLTGMAAGSYRVGFSDPSGKYATEFYADATSLGAATPFAVAGGKLTGSINAALSPPPTASSATAPAPVGELTVESGHALTVSRGEVTIKLACSGSGSCRGRATLTVELVTRHRHKKLSRQVAIGTASFEFTGGHSLQLAIRLNHAGRSELSQHHYRLSSELQITGSASGTAVRLSSAVVLTAKKHV